MSLPLQMALLVAALCLDSFAASFAFGAQKIRIPPASALVISGVCSLFLAASLFFGGALRPFLPRALASAVSFCILAALGIMRLMDSLLKSCIRRSQSGCADLRFRFMSFSFLLRVWADSTEADSDHSKRLTPREALPLAVALSLDGLAAGFGAGMAQANLGAMVTLSFCIDLLLLLLGAALGRHAAVRSGLNFSWLGGAMLLCLAVLRLF